METYYKLLSDLEHNLMAIENKVKNIHCLSGQCVSLCEETLKRLKVIVLKNGFTSDEQEIEFYKHIKPKILSYLIFYVKRLDITSKCPIEGEKEGIKYLKKHISLLQNYFNNNLEFYNYFKSNAEHLDEHYFLRANKTVRLNIEAYHFFTDEDFSTSHDSTVATIMAYTKLIDYLKSVIAKINTTNKMETTINPFEKQSKLHWTGTPTELVEMCYSLYACGRINNGNGDIIDIIRGFSELLNIEVKNPYDTFSEIRGRKTSKTKFTDIQRTSLQKYIDDHDDLKKK